MKPQTFGNYIGAYIWGKKFRFVCLLLGLGVFLPELSWAAGMADAVLAEKLMSSGGMLWLLPFAGLILSLALAPLFFRHIWDDHFDKITLVWLFLMLVPLVLLVGVGDAFQLVLGVTLHEYLPFVILLLTLFVISGNIVITGYFDGTPKKNFILLLLGTSLASFMGTMGASMLLVRPFFRSLQQRHYRSHSLLFFILLVSNIGGSLTPLGDPPLFLGFLKGVTFGWTFVHMLPPFLVSASLLLITYGILDYLLYRREKPKKHTNPPGQFRMKGTHNILLLLLVVLVILASGGTFDNILQKLHLPLEFYIVGVVNSSSGTLREVLLLIIAWLSWNTTKRTVREENEFHWHPQKEVAILFFGIFITLVPCLALLKGHMGQELQFILSRADAPNPDAYFWLTGFFSSILDNAPTYLVFFHLASGDATVMMNELSHVLLAISLGAVYMGANTYIGNAPNFMVKTIAGDYKMDKLHFFAYSFWALIVLMPIYLLITYFFI